MAATIYRRDYLQRYVLTPTGTATDYSGRLTTTTADYMGRNLQATEPSVLGVQVAYAGYFTPMTVESGGIQKIVNLA